MNMRIKVKGDQFVEQDATLLQEVQINNKPFAVIDFGSGQYVKGVFSRYFVVSTASLVKQVENIRDE